MKDWMIRALKTFVQAFFGILVPELVLFLNGSLPKDFEGMKAMMSPMLCSALAAGISALWNYVSEKLKTE